MKKHVEFSAFAVVMTILTFVMLAGICLWQYNKSGMGAECWVLIVCIVVWGLACLFYAPCSIELNEGYLSIHRPVRTKKIPLSDVASVRACPPTMAARRICGSGGCFGYWGWFSERDLGKYFAYYGKSSDCFLVVLKNGKLYMLGCKDASEMGAAIQAKLDK